MASSTNASSTIDLSQVELVGLPTPMEEDPSNGTAKPKQGSKAKRKAGRSAPNWRPVEMLLALKAALVCLDRLWVSLTVLTHPHDQSSILLPDVIHFRLRNVE
jgi:hypothetical protein